MSLCDDNRPREPSFSSDGIVEDQWEADQLAQAAGLSSAPTEPDPEPRLSAGELIVGIVIVGFVFWMGVFWFIHWTFQK